MEYKSLMGAIGSRGRLWYVVYFEYVGWGRSGRLRRYVDEMNGKRDEKLNQYGKQYVILRYVNFRSSRI